MTSRNGSITFERGELSSYYGRPILKEPVWKPEIPCYFFTGGLATGAVANDLSALIEDPNSRIHEAKAFSCAVRKGRL